MTKRSIGKTLNRTFHSEFRAIKRSELIDELAFLKGKKFAAVSEVAYPGLDPAYFVELVPSDLQNLLEKVSRLSKRATEATRSRKELEAQLVEAKAMLERLARRLQESELNLRNQTAVNDELRRANNASWTDRSGRMKVSGTVFAENSHIMLNPNALGQKQSKS